MTDWRQEHDGIFPAPVFEPYRLILRVDQDAIFERTDARLDLRTQTRTYMTMEAGLITETLGSPGLAKIGAEIADGTLYRVIWRMTGDNAHLRVTFRWGVCAGRGAAVFFDDQAIERRFPRNEPATKIYTPHANMAPVEYIAGDALVYVNVSIDF